MDELSLVKGSRILILEKSNDGWWKGQYGNHVGWFPSNYTQEENEDETVHTYAMAENVLDIMVALYNFTAQVTEELYRKLFVKIIVWLKNTHSWIEIFYRMTKS